MRHMFLEWFADNPLLYGPIVALVLFSAIFAVVAFRVWRNGAAAYERQAHLPLEDRDE